MYLKMKKYIKKKLTSIIADLQKEEKKKMWWRFTSMPNINIHHTFVPQDADIFKGNGGEFGVVNIDEGFLVRDYCSIVSHPDSKLTIGKGVFFNNYSSINCLDKITIGDNSIFGEGVRLYDHNHEYGFDPDFFVDKTEFKKRPISIGKNCWIGSNTIILKGVEIGDNCIIGAGCIIHKSIPDNTIVKNSQNLLFTSLKHE